MTKQVLQETNLAHFKRLIASNGGDVAAAIKGLLGRTPAELAEVMGLPRQTVQQCLKNNEGRNYGHVRRALEAELGLPAYALDPILDTAH